MNIKPVPKWKRVEIMVSHYLPYVNTALLIIILIILIKG